MRWINPGGGTARVGARPSYLLLVLAGGACAVLLAACSTGQESTVGQGDNGQGGTPSAGSSSSSSASSPSDKNAKVGQALNITGNGGLKVSVTLESVKTATKGEGAIAEPPKNGLYLVGDFLIVDQAGDYDFNLLYLKYQAPDGTTFTGLDGNAATAGFEPSLSAGTLHAGQRTRGVVAFDVPAAGGVIQLTDPLGSVVGQWTL